MDKFFLKILLWFVSKTNGNEVNFSQLRIITETKLLMDQRRIPVSWKKRQQSNNSNSMIVTYIIYGIMSLFVGIQILVLQNLVFSMIIYHSYLLFLMAMTLITDFSAVLLDTADNHILVPKPVNSRTLFLSRAIHITIYLLKYFLIISFFPIIFTFVHFGLLVGLGVIITSALTVVFAIFSTYILYGLILRFGDEQKIKDVVGYFQIFMTVIFFAGFQIVPRLMDFNENFSFTVHTYTYFIPAAWMSFFLEGIQNLRFDTVHLIMTACCFLIPLITLWFMMKFLAPSFSRKLNALGTVSAHHKNEKEVKTHQRMGISERLLDAVCRGNEEQAGFLQVWKITARDKAFKIGFYPSIAYLFVLLFVTFINNKTSFQVQMAELPLTDKYLFLIYMPVFVASGALTLIPYYENYAAGWIYQALPLAKPGNLINGGLKALLCKFFLPFFLLMFSIGFYVWGWKIIDDFIFGFCNDILIFYIMILAQDSYLPFSQKPAIKQQGGKFAKAFIQMIIIAALVGLHYLALKVSWLTAILIPAPLILVYFLQKKLKELAWYKIKI